MNNLSRNFNDPEYVDRLVKMYADQGIIIDVKTCLYSDGFNFGGKFTFKKEDHYVLKNNEGYYLFLVWDGLTLVRHSLLRAKDIIFAKSISWGHVMGS